MGRPRILVVEDEINVAMDILRRLQRLGYDVAAVVTSAEEAIHRAAEARPDLALMDIALPGEMDGIEAAQHIRARFAIPTVYLTAQVDDQTLQRAKVTEPSGFLLKPFEDRELRATIEMALYKHQMERKLQASEQWLATTLKGIGDAVIAADPQGYITFMNPVAEALTGWRQEEAAGQTLTGVFQISDDAAHSPSPSAVTQALMDGNSAQLTDRILIAKDGTERPIDATAAPIRADKGNLTGMVMIFRDITERKRVEEAVRQSEEKFRIVTETANDGIISADTHGNITYLNTTAERMFGYAAPDAVGQPLTLLMPERFHEAHRHGLHRYVSTGKRKLADTVELVGKKKDGSEFPLELSLASSQTHGSASFTAIIRDTTERKRVEEALRESEEQAHRQYQDLQALHRVAEAVSHSLELGQVLQTALKSSIDAIAVEAGIIRLLDEEGGLVIVAHVGITFDYLERMWRLAPGQGISATTFTSRQTQIVTDIAHDPRYTKIAIREDANSLASIPIMEKEKVLGVMNVVSHGPRQFTGDDIKLLTAIGRQAGIAITNARLFEEMEATNRRRLALNQVAQTVNQSLNLQEVLDAALDATLNAVEVEGGNIRLWDEPQGVLIVAAFRGMSEWYIDQRRYFKPGEGVAGKVFERGETFLVEDMEQYPHLNEMAQRDGVRSVASIPIRSRDKMVGVMSILSHGQRRFTPPEIDLLTAIGNQIGTAIENARLFESIAQGKLELERSNQELEQFAYVASHDLQEPLRMVSNYMRLLARRYKGRFDADADEFIDYAVDGAKRMQTLIQDLLAYSRVGTRGREFEPSDCEGIFGQAIANLQMSVEECGAVVTHDPLPTVRGDGTQLSQLFQNLIGNAIKFRSEKPPAVHVGAARQAGAWLFSVRDNGIGIDLGHAERIFLIFQRLHHKTEYPGTGIGLAICKRIVERHGGRIWMQSEPGEGTTFYFTIPDRQ